MMNPHYPINLEHETSRSDNPDTAAAAPEEEEVGFLHNEATADPLRQAKEKQGKGI